MTAVTDETLERALEVMAWEGHPAPTPGESWEDAAHWNPGGQP